MTTYYSHFNTGLGFTKRLFNQKASKSTIIKCKEQSKNMKYKDNVVTNKDNS